MSDHHAEIRACDEVLGRNPDFPIGFSTGVTSALLVVSFGWFCHHIVREPAFSKFDDVAAYGLLGLLSVPTYVVGWLVVALYHPDWPDGRDAFAGIGIALAFWGVMSALRWTMRRVAA